jgi:hypothetical protein
MTPAPLKVLLVQHDPTFAGLLSMWFGMAGFEPVGCPSPGTEDYYCGFALDENGNVAYKDEGKSGDLSCPAVDEGDVLLYDPWLYLDPKKPDARELLGALRNKYPHQPVVLVWPDENMPAFDPDISTLPGIYVGPRNLKQLVDFVTEICKDITPAAPAGDQGSQVR